MNERIARTKGRITEPKKKKRKEKTKKETSALFYLRQLNTRSETSTAFVPRIFIARLSTCSTNVCYPMPARVSFRPVILYVRQSGPGLKRRIILADLSRGRHRIHRGSKGSGLRNKALLTKRAVVDGSSSTNDLREQQNVKLIRSAKGTKSFLVSGSNDEHTSCR